MVGRSVHSGERHSPLGSPAPLSVPARLTLSEKQYSLVRDEGTPPSEVHDKPGGRAYGGGTMMHHCKIPIADRQTSQE